MVHTQQFTSLLRLMKTFLIVSRSWPEMCFSSILSKLEWDDSDRSIWRPKYLQVKAVHNHSGQTTITRSLWHKQERAWKWFYHLMGEDLTNPKSPVTPLWPVTTYLVLGETSCTNLVTACKILSVRSLIPERRRAAPTFSTRFTKWRAVHCLTRVLGWLLEEGQHI